MEDDILEQEIREQLGELGMDEESIDATIEAMSEMD